MKPLFRWAAVVLMIPMAGCYTAQKQQLLNDDFRDAPVALPLTLGKISVIDGRTGVEARPLKLHVSSQEHADAVQPALTPARTKLIENELARYFSLGKTPVAVTATLTKGRQAFEGSSMRAKESAQAEVKLTFVDVSTGQTMFHGWGTSQPEVESGSASQAFSDALFDRALQIAVYAAVRGIDKDLYPAE